MTCVFISVCWKWKYSLSAKQGGWRVPQVKVSALYPPRGFTRSFRCVFVCVCVKGTWWLWGRCSCIWGGQTGCWGYTEPSSAPSPPPPLPGTAWWRVGTGMWGANAGSRSYLHAHCGKHSSQTIMSRERLSVTHKKRELSMNNFQFNVIPSLV